MVVVVALVGGYHVARVFLRPFYSLLDIASLRRASNYYLPWIWAVLHHLLPVFPPLVPVIQYLKHRSGLECNLTVTGLQSVLRSIPTAAHNYPYSVLTKCKEGFRRRQRWRVLLLEIYLREVEVVRNLKQRIAGLIIL